MEWIPWIVHYSTPPGQNGRHFADDIFRCIFVTEKFRILIDISLKFVPKGLVDSLDNCLAPNRRQAIIWTNVDSIHWRIYAALGGDELCEAHPWIDIYIVTHSLWLNYLIQPQRSGSTLDQIMAWCMLGGKPLPEPIWCRLQNGATWCSFQCVDINLWLFLFA